MALPNLTDLKNYLRIETNREDSVVTDILTSATAWAEALLGKPITAIQKTFTVKGATDSYGRSYFYLPVYPLLTSTGNEAVVTDVDSTTVDSSTYAVDGISGRFLANTGESFSHAPYKVVAKVGFSAHPEYSTIIEPQIRALIIGLASIIYHQRNPNATSDSSGGGVSVSYSDNPLPKHLDSIVMRLNPPRVR